MASSAQVSSTGGLVNRTRGVLRASRRLFGSEAFAHSLLVTPALLFYIVFQVIPVVAQLGFSFTDWSGLGLGNLRWIGLGNFAELLRDSFFWRSARITGVYVIVVAPLLVVLSLMAAVAINGRSRLKGLARTAILVPIAMSPVSIGTLFGFLASPTLGFPALLKSVVRVNILNHPTGALATVISAQIWAGLGTNAFVFLAGLQTIPEEVYEAAMIDGAGALSRFRLITLPLLRETLIMNTVVTLIGAFNTFGLVYTMTGGGPYHATEVLSMFMYKKAFIGFRLGYASAVAVILFLIVATITFIQMRIARAGRTTYY